MAGSIWYRLSGGPQDPTHREPSARVRVARLVHRDGATWTGHSWFYRSSGNICNLQETEPIHIHVFYVESISDSPSNRVQVSKTWI